MKTHQSLLQYLLYWYKHVQYITVPDDWSNPIPWCFWSIFGLCKIFNDRSVEQETVGMTPRMATTFPKFQRDLWPKKIFGYIYTKITQIMFFRIFSHRSRAYLKPSTNFANILDESSSQILAYRAFQLNSEWNFANLFHWLIISSSNHWD